MHLYLEDLNPYTWHQEIWNWSKHHCTRKKRVPQLLEVGVPDINGASWVVALEDSPRKRMLCLMRPVKSNRHRETKLQRWDCLIPMPKQPAERWCDRAISAADGSTGHQCDPQKCLSLGGRRQAMKFCESQNYVKENQGLGCCMDAMKPGGTELRSPPQFSGLGPTVERGSQPRWEKLVRWAGNTLSTLPLGQINLRMLVCGSPGRTMHFKNNRWRHLKTSCWWHTVQSCSLWQWHKGASYLSRSKGFTY